MQQLAEPGTSAPPAIKDLLERLRFLPQEGLISLGGQRMLLLHAAAVQTLRHELIETLGVERARATLTRMGYQAGAHDATFARQVRAAGPPLDMFWVGPQLHSIEGVVRVELLRMEIDLEAGHHYGEFLWHDSLEDEDHANRDGLSDAPVCWMQIGYASGYTSAFMGRTIVYREVECRAMGFDQCRVVGQPVKAWGDVSEDMYYLGLKASAASPPRLLPRQAPIPQASARVGGKCADSDGTTTLVGKDPAFTAALEQLTQVAGSDATVLLCGETGVGKERFARELHLLSRRRNGPFVAVNCAALPDTLLEAELFGVEKGAYTGASASRAGRFERADHGTLFLDEVASLSDAGQAKLLRVLQELEVERLGSVRARPIDVRVVAASQEDLAHRVADGRFRRDLFYRLAVVPIRIPALRERPLDIPLLAAHCLAHAQARHDRRSSGFATGALDALQRHPFPGNVRELENLIERAVLLTAPGQRITAERLLAPSILGIPHTVQLWANMRDSGLSLPQMEAQILSAAVAQANGNLSQAARGLGISRAQLAYRLGKHRLAGQSAVRKAR
ncbi:MAG: sigma 54-interacting transcriptional regulator [Immundisolibacter sp.]|uniref:sigma 54-interacting transcriptional regulator n=1 Tax=Immundisolibacter sp. TaxID=1934948 RepID=UPI003EE401C5